MPEKLNPVRRSPSKLLRQCPHIDVVAPLERCFSDLVLLQVVIPTEAYRPSIGRLEADAAIGVSPNVRTFYRS